MVVALRFGRQFRQMEALARNGAFARPNPRHPSSRLSSGELPWVCARSPTNRRRVTALGDGLSFDAADEQMLSALEREEQ
eukprot:scaffold36529_cov62-Phaeocystis_antarctica.AAC.5